MKTPELLPCPFCGGKTYLEEFEPHEHFFVELPAYPGGAMITCRECEGRLSFSGKDAGGKVIEAWNTRIYPKDVREAIEKNNSVKVKLHRTKHATYPHCPLCNSSVTSLYSFCPNCGQKLDWSRNEKPL